MKIDKYVKNYMSMSNKFSWDLQVLIFISLQTSDKVITDVTPNKDPIKTNNSFGHPKNGPE